MYIVCKLFNGKSISGIVNLPVNTELEKRDNLLLYNNKPICYITSQNCYDYFSNNADGKGKQRFNLVNKIKAELERLANEYNELFIKLYTDEENLPDIKPIETNVTLNYEFYNKPVNELQSIYDKLKEEKYE